MPNDLSSLHLTVGFAGHRQMSGSEALPSLMSRAFELIKNTADALSRSSDPQLRLLTGYAPGADRVAVSCWKQHLRGSVHGLFPFLDPDSPESPIAYTNRPGKTSDEDRVDVRDSDLFDKVTVLDGASRENEVPGRSAHLEQARWLVRFSDILLVVWNGKPAGGPGGTADSVELALDKEIPVLWINSEDPGELMLIRPGDIWQDLSMGELCVRLTPENRREFAEPATVEGLTTILQPHLEPPWHLSSHDPGETQAHPERISFLAFEESAAAVRDGKRRSLTDRLISGQFERFKRLMAGRDPQRIPTARPADISTNPPDDLKDSFAIADEVANRLGAEHRSVQLMLLYLATWAVFFGIVPAAKDIGILKEFHFLKIVCVSIEGVILLTMLWVWNSARKLRRHRAWSDARRWAERLRAMQSTWPLGIDVNDGNATPAATWTEWQAKAMLRKLGPPAGNMTGEIHKAALEAGRVNIVESQIRYHDGNHSVAHRVHHRMEGIENKLFGMLLSIIVVFLIWSSLPYLGLPWDSPWLNPPKPFAAILLILSGVIPAIGATFIAIEAQLDFAGSSRRSAAMKPEFEDLNHNLAAILKDKSGNPPLSKARMLLRQAAQLTVSDVDGWRSELERRRIIRGP